MGVAHANVAIVGRFLCNVGYDLQEARIDDDDDDDIYLRPAGRGWNPRP